MCFFRTTGSLFTLALILILLFFTNSYATHFDKSKDPDQMWDSRKTNGLGTLGGYLYETIEDYDQYRQGNGLDWEDSDWEIINKTEMTFQDAYPKGLGENHSDTYCVGIIKYKTLAQESPYPILNQYGIVESWAYGYYATPKDDGWDDCTDDIQEMERPGLLYLHGLGGHGSYLEAAFMAAMVSTSNDPVFVLAISGPGQGITCETHWELNNITECDATDGWPHNQISIGDSATEKGEMYDGFSSSTTVPIDTDHNVLWAWAMSAMRAITLFEKVLEVAGTGDDPVEWTNGKLVLAGTSMGGVTTLITSSIDTRLDGAISISATGGIKENYNVPGNWSSKRIFYFEGEIVPLLTANSKINCSSTTAPYQDATCNSLDYFEPTLFEPNTDVLFSLGAQDESFSHEALYNTIKPVGDGGMDFGSNQYYLHYQADMDHMAFYMGWNDIAEFNTRYKILGDKVEAFTNFDIDFSQTNNGVNRAYSSVKAFFHKSVGNYSSTFHTPLAQPTITYDGYSSGTASWEICLETDSSEISSGVWFNITVDDFYHILPACDNLSDSWNNYTYSMNMSGDGYDYNSECFHLNRHSEKCEATGTTQATFDSHVSEDNMATSGDWEAAEPTCGGGTCDHCMTLEITGLSSEDDIPDRIGAWAEHRYDISVDGITVKNVTSGEVKGWPTPLTGQERPEPCIRTVYGVLSADRFADKRQVFSAGFEADDVEDHVVDETAEFEDGNLIELLGYNIIFGEGNDDGIWEVDDGHLTIVTNADITINEDSAIKATDTDGGYLEIYARNITVESGGEIDAIGTANGGKIFLYSYEKTTIDGDILASGDTEGGTIILEGAGDLEVSGKIDAGSEDKGGSIYIDFKGDIEFNGTADVFARATEMAGSGGMIDVATNITLTIDSGAEFRASGGASSGTIDFTYCESDISGSATFDPSYDGTPYCPFTLEDTNITTDTTWEIGDSPFLVLDDIYVCKAKLTIEPGVEVYFADGASLYIGDPGGTCTPGQEEEPSELYAYAGGANDDPIVFTSYYTYPIAGDWGVIAFFANSGDNVLNNVSITYGGNSSKGMSVLVKNNSTDIDEAEIGWSGSKGILFYGFSAKVDVNESWIHDCEDSGVKLTTVTNANSKIDNTDIEFTKIGIELATGSTLEVDSCGIYDNWEVGIDVLFSKLNLHDTYVVGNSALGTEWSTHQVAAGVFLRYNAFSTCSMTPNNAFYGNMPDNDDLYAEYEVFNASIRDFDASDCYWGDGVDTAEEIDGVIYDENDEGTRGNIDYSDWLSSPPE